jgi:hypothetical protein
MLIAALIEPWCDQIVGMSVRGFIVALGYENISRNCELIDERLSVNEARRDHLINVCDFVGAPKKITVLLVFVSFPRLSLKRFR